MCRLSGKVPMIGTVAGWCYAGNAAILGVTDLIIATEDSLVAMGGPATIEGGGTAPVAAGNGGVRRRKRKAGHGQHGGSIMRSRCSSM